MSNAEVLTAVARILVDQPFREAFLADPAAALSPLALTPPEREGLLAVEPDTVVLLGRIADYHRWMRIVDYVPWLDMDLRPDLIPLVRHYMRSAPPGLLCRDEALAFCRFVMREADCEPAYLCDLARYERLRISIAWGLHGDTTDVASVPFTFPVTEIAERLGQPGWPAVEPRPCRLAFKKVPGIPAVLVREITL